MTIDSSDSNLTKNFLPTKHMILPYFSPWIRRTI
jgi:hypothetical protein